MTSHKARIATTIRRYGLASAFLAGTALAPAFSADNAAQKTIPNFAPDVKTGWQLSDDDFVLPPEGGPGPVVSDPRYPYTSFYRFQQNPNPTFRIADLNNIILQPSTREALRKANEKVLAGEIIAVPKERCWPVGVPAFLLYPATPVYFLQTPKEVVMIWMQDHQVRRIRLNEQHDPNPRSGWFGDSVGHYEGDTLVVDTIGLSPRTFVDNYFTPHTEQLHVVERFRMIEDGTDAAKSRSMSRIPARSRCPGTPCSFTGAWKTAPWSRLSAPRTTTIISTTGWRPSRPPRGPISDLGRDG